MKDEGEALVIGLTALCWTLEDTVRADRLLSLTGLSAADLRASAGDRHVLAAVLAFLEAHEPDLVACAKALEIDPKILVSARMFLDTPVP